MIYSSIAMIVSIFSAGINASFGNVIVKADREILQKSYDTYAYIFKIMSFAFYTIALVLTIPFLKIYIVNTDGVDYIIPFVAIGFAVSGLFRSIRIAPVTLVEAAGKFRDNKVFNVIEAMSNVLLSILLINRFGITGILFASSLTALIRSIMYVVYTEKNILSRKCGKELINIFANIIMAVVLIITANHIIQSIKISNFFEWTVSAIVTTTAVLGVTTIFNSFMSWKSAKDIVKRIKMLVYNKD